MPYPWVISKKPKLFGHTWIVSKRADIYTKGTNPLSPLSAYIYLTDGSWGNNVKEFDHETEAFKMAEDLNNGGEIK